MIIDDGEDEKKIIERLKLMYSKSSWNTDNFSQFSEHDFEKYYPNRFQQQVDNVLIIKNKKEKRKQKKILLDEVKKWIMNNEETAKEEFRISAKSVINKLFKIEKEL